MYFMCECICNKLLPSSNSHATSSSSSLTYKKLIAQLFAFYSPLQYLSFVYIQQSWRFYVIFLLQISCDAILMRGKCKNLYVDCTFASYGWMWERSCEALNAIFCKLSFTFLHTCSIYKIQENTGLVTSFFCMVWNNLLRSGNEKTLSNKTRECTQWRHYYNSYLWVSKHFDFLTRLKLLILIPLTWSELNFIRQSFFPLLLFTSAFCIRNESLKDKSKSFDEHKHDFNCIFGC